MIEEESPISVAPVFEAQIDARLAGHAWDDIRSHEADLRVTHELMGSDFNTAAGYQPYGAFEARMGVSQRGLMTGETQVADARSPNPWAQKSMLEGGVVGGGGGMGGPRAAARPSPYKLVEQPAAPHEEAMPGFKRFEIHENGVPKGSAAVNIEGAKANIDYVGMDSGAGTAANSFGPRAVRDIAKQFFEQHPDVTELSGYRVSGARVQTGSGPGSVTLNRNMFFPGE